MGSASAAFSISIGSSMLCFCSAVSDSGAQKRVFSSASFGIGVVGDLDLDHPVDVVGVAVRRLRALLHRGNQLVLVELLALARGADESVARAAGVLGDRRARPRRCRSGCRPRARRKSKRPWCGSTRPSKSTRSPSHSSRISLIASRSRANRSLKSGQSPSYPVAISLSASPVPTPRKIRSGYRQPIGRERLRDDGRVVAEGRRQHRRAEHQPLGALPHRGHPGQRERSVSALVPPRLEVVADRRAVHAVLFGSDGQLDEFARRELLRRCLVSKFQFSHTSFLLHCLHSRDGSSSERHHRHRALRRRPTW